VVRERVETYSWWTLARKPGFPGQRPSRVCFCSLRNWFPGQRPSRVCFCSLRNWFPGQRPSRVCFYSLRNWFPGQRPWRYADGATTSRRPVQQCAWRHWGSTTTLIGQQRKSVYHICCIWYFYSTPAYHGSIAGYHGSYFVSVFTKYIASNILFS
jgi:hypothetical protein